VYAYPIHVKSVTTVRLRWARHTQTRKGEMRIANRVLGVNDEGRDNFERPSRRKENNSKMCINPLNAELNPICYLLALLAHHFLHVSRIRVKPLGY